MYRGRRTLNNNLFHGDHGLSSGDRLPEPVIE
jgi:hypothetical protein